MHTGNGWISFRKSCCTCKWPLAFMQVYASSDRYHTRWFSVCHAVLGFFLAALHGPSVMARAEPAPHHGCCLRSAGNSCLLACFPGKTQETLPLWRQQTFLHVDTFRIPLNPSQGTSGGLLERESQSSHLQGQATKAVRCSGWVVRRLSHFSHDHPTTYKWTSLPLVLLQLWTYSS